MQMLRAMLSISVMLAAVCVAVPARGQHGRILEPGDDRPQLPWQVRLGLRVETVNRGFPLVDQVVLVPDAATYLDELSRWSPQGRWPVLFEDDRLAPMFIRRFDPQRVIRRESVGEDLPGDRSARQERLVEVVRTVWGRRDATETLADMFVAGRYPPPGVVVTSVDDPAWPAAVALAAGRGQPFIWLDDDLGRPNGAMSINRAANLRDRITQTIADTGLAYDTLGDDVETITICRTMAGAYTRGDERLAMTDLLGRTAAGERYAFTGWIFGDETFSAYAAMCSLFLERRSFLLIDTYDGEAFAPYAADLALGTLRAQGYEPISAGDAPADLQAWQRFLRGGVSADVILAGTAGSKDVFRLRDGVNASSLDVPVLNAPAAVHFIHSWSMATPADDRTIAARWLQHGAYAYVGSVHEPYLQAFIPPEHFVHRMATRVPMLVAARHWEGQMARPWKVNTFGDPLMLCRLPSDPAPPHVDPREPGAGETDLAEHAKALMRAVQSDSAGGPIEEAMRTLVLLGRDDLAAKLWTIAAQRGRGAEAARHALGPLFRARDEAAFRAAYAEALVRDDLAMDMLWHLLTPRLRTLDGDALLLLQASLRRPLAHVDLERLAPQLEQAFGRLHVQRIADRERERAANRGVEAGMERLLEALQDGERE